MPAQGQLNLDTTLARYVPACAGSLALAHVGQSFTVPAGSEGFLHTLKILKFTKTSGPYDVSIIAVDISGFPTGGVIVTTPVGSGAFGPATLTLYPNVTLTVLGC